MSGHCTPMPDMKCDCCGSNESIAGVCASSLGPASFCFCVPCLENNAEPVGVFHYLFDDVGNDGEGLASWVNNMSTYQDGRYWKWQEWKEWRKANPPKEPVNDADQQPS